MSDNQADHEDHDSTTDDLEQEKPAKKRRKTKQALDERPSSFPLLNHGAEASEFSQIRHDVFKEIWDRKQARIDELVHKADENALNDIASFIRSSQSTDTQKLKTALIVSGPDGSAQTRLLERWKTSQDENCPEIVVQLQASHCVNLQTTLRNIIKHSISTQIGGGGYQTFLNDHKRLIPMNFDLELLATFAKENDVQNIVLSILDVETFDTGILSELLSMLTLWSNSIPFVVLLGIATTAQLFETRLPKSTIDLLDATTFTLQSSSDVLEQILDEIQNDPDQKITFGQSVITALEDLSQSQGTTVAAFTCAVKYAVMSHFFANSLSVLVAGSKTIGVDSSLCTAVRNTPSFQQHCESLLARNSKASAKEVKELLTNDKTLIQAVFENDPTQKKLNVNESHHINNRQVLNSFTPRPRHALERALSKPADYLGCDCCQNNATSSSSPPTSILYTLLQEAGTVINVRDLYDAFCARAFLPQELETDGAVGDRANREQMSTFYTALAELKMLGLVKGSTSAVIKKRAIALSGGVADDGSGMTVASRAKERYGDVDFVAKTGWAGL